MATWVVRCPDEGQSQGFYERGIAAAHWSGVRNLGEVTTRAELQRLVDAEYARESPGARFAIAEQLYAFRVEMTVGDGVVTYHRPTRQYHVGVVLGDYLYNLRASGSAPHTRAVQWQGVVHRDDLSADSRLKLGQHREVFKVRDSVWDELSDIRSGGHAAARAYDDETLEEARVETEERMRDVLANRLSALLPSELERLVMGLLEATGLHSVGPATGSGAARCLVASPGGLGLDEPRVRVHIEEPRRVPLDATATRAFVASLRPGEKGLLVCTGGFAVEARRETERGSAAVTLADLDLLVQLVLRHYETLRPDVRAMLPLARFYWPT